jgi:nucleotide-binding universal stress UspA family protein
MPGILVGVDGSDHSRRALSWAMREAAAHQVPLTVIAVHQEAPRPATQIYWNVPTLPEGSPDPELARTAVRKWVDTVADEDGQTEPEIVVDVRTGDAAEELVNASYDADLLVVGSRGSGVWAQLLLGSVSSKVVHHAACPIVVVPGSRQVP